MTSLLFLSVYFPFCSLIPTFCSIFVTYHLTYYNYTRVIFYSFISGELIFEGNETPVYVGSSRIIICKWAGLENIIKLELYLEGNGLGVRWMNDDTATAIDSGHISDISWNGKIFQCIATFNRNRTLTKNFALWVKGKYTIIMVIHFT